ncbi:MAG: hypothetical protein WA115_06080 [Polynucleobacter sp.]
MNKIRSRINEAARTVVKISKDRINTNLVLKMARSINVPLKSSMGPNTRKDSKEPAEKVEMNDDATNASEVEHKDMIYANAIMKK